MNVARKSTAKLPQRWQPVQKVSSKEDEGDSGVGSADSTDSFQDALMNLKALSGGSDNVVSDRSELKEFSATGFSAKAEDSNKNKGVSSSKTNGEEKDILDQIDDIVNDKQASDKSDTNGELACKSDTVKDIVSSQQGSEEEDDILIISEDVQNEDSKDIKSDVVPRTTVDSTMDSKNKVTPGTGPKNPLRIGEKVRSTVHSIMSKLAQNNPDVNSLLSKTKSEGSGDSGGSGTSSPLTVRQDKGNLFDNFDMTDCDGKSPSVSAKDVKLPQPASDTATASTEVADVKPDKDPCVKNGPDSEVTKEGEMEKMEDNKEEELSQSKGITIPKANLINNQEQLDSVQPLTSADATDEKLDSKEAVECEESQSSCAHEEKADLEDSEENVDPSVTSSALPDDSCATVMKASSPGAQDSPRLTRGDSHETDSQEAKTMETTESEASDKAIPEAAADTSPTHGDKTSSEDRKRQHDSRTAESDEDNDDSLPQKRSRLDEVIGKLGERVPFPSDGLENDFDYEDSPAGDAESVEKQSEEISASASEEEEDKAASPESKTIKLSKQELEALVVTTAKAAIEHYQSSEILALNRRIEELVQAEEEWRQKAKSLERQVLDLTVLQQRLEKRKAHTAALKSITTRSIGVGVTEDKLKTNTPQKQPGNRTPPATPPATAVSTLVWAPAGQAAGRLISSTGTPVLPTPNGGLPVTCSALSRNTSVAHLLSQTARMPTAASCAAATRTTPPKPNSTMLRAPGAVTTLSSIPNVTMSKVPAGVSTSLVLVNSSTGSVGTKVATSSQLIGNPMIAPSPAGSGQVKIIDLTMEDDGGGSKQLAKQVVGSAPVRGMVPQQIVRQLAPMSQGVAGVPSSAILLSSPAGTQVVNTAGLQRPGMLQPLQVVTIPNAANLRAGSLVTVVPSQPSSMVRQPSSSTTLTTTARESAPRLVTQQLPAGMTFVRPPNNSGVRASSLPPGGSATTAAGARMPVAVTTLSQGASGQRENASVATPAAASRTCPHPAPLPPYISPRVLPPDAKAPPPRPGLKISRVKQGIVLSWNMVLPSDCVEIASYQLFAYQETNNTVPQTSLWKKVGDVKALPLPMACTLTQFQDGNKYHFAVRAIDVHGRSGQFSEPSFIYLTKAA